MRKAPTATVTIWSLAARARAFPSHCLPRLERCERIPMLRDCDSLDNAEAWEAHEESLGHTEDSHETILQQDICGNFVNPDDYRISALNLSNSAAIVLYEALRQTGFPGM